jgi:O-succinylbenzoic acid--CoA ligase
MRELKVVDVSDPRALQEPLNDALFHNGPAVLPRPGGAKLTATAPMEVEDSVALVIETSGTTGAPKRVALSAPALLASVEAAHQELGGSGQWLQLLPAHYIAGVQVVTRSLVAGTTAVVLHPEPFSTAAISGVADWLLGQSAPLYTSVVPAQLQRILDDGPSIPRLDELTRRFSAILVGGQSIPETLVSRAADAGYRLIRTYGSSETAGGCVWDQRPIGDTRVRDIEGRLAITGSVLASGYVGDPERTARSFVMDGDDRWYLSDDAGHLTGEGLVVVDGRLDDVIVSGGVKIALAAVEKTIQRELGVADVFVVGAHHSEWGHVPVVVTTQVVDLVRIRLAVQRALGVEARPDRVITVPTIPLLGSGKPDRLAMTALAEGPHA